MVFCVAAITEACSEVIDAGLLPSLMKLLATTFDVKKEVCSCIQYSAKYSFVVSEFNYRYTEPVFF